MAEPAIAAPSNDLSSTSVNGRSSTRVLHCPHNQPAASASTEFDLVTQSADSPQSRAETPWRVAPWFVLASLRVAVDRCCIDIDNAWTVIRDDDFDANTGGSRCRIEGTHNEFTTASVLNSVGYEFADNDSELGGFVFSQTQSTSQTLGAWRTPRSVVDV